MNLRSKLIRLAKNNPEIREDILPLLVEKKANKKGFYVVESENGEFFAVAEEFIRKKYIGDFTPYENWNGRVDGEIFAGSHRDQLKSIDGLFWSVNMMYGLFDEGLVNEKIIKAFQ